MWGETQTYTYANFTIFESHKVQQKHNLTRDHIEIDWFPSGFLFLLFEVRIWWICCWILFFFCLAFSGGPNDQNQKLGFDTILSFSVFACTLRTKGNFHVFVLKKSKILRVPICVGTFRSTGMWGSFILMSCTWYSVDHWSCDILWHITK